MSSDEQWIAVDSREGLGLPISFHIFPILSISSCLVSLRMRRPKSGAVRSYIRWDAHPMFVPMVHPTPIDPVARRASLAKRAGIGRAPTNWKLCSAQMVLRCTGCGEGRRSFIMRHGGSLVRPELAKATGQAPFLWRACCLRCPMTIRRRSSTVMASAPASCTRRRSVGTVTFTLASSKSSFVF